MCDDQISDAILDAMIAKDEDAKMNCEMLMMQGTVVVTDQITNTYCFNIKQIVREVVHDTDFGNAKDGLDWEIFGEGTQTSPRNRRIRPRPLGPS